MKKTLTLLNTLIIGFAAIAWTGTGESSDPVLADREIPADIASTCALTQACDQPAFSRRWVAKTLQGDLYIVINERCTGSDCRAWLVEKSASAAKPVRASRPACARERRRLPPSPPESSLRYSGAAADSLELTSTPAAASAAAPCRSDLREINRDCDMFSRHPWRCY